MGVTVREKPRLGLSALAITPNGNRYRWAADEPNPANVPSGMSCGSSMPGGFDQADVTLPRKANIDYSDLERLTTVQFIGAGGEIAGEYRLESAPRTSGDEMSVSPGLVGWQAHLDDDKSAREIYVDIDLTRWGGPSVQRKIDAIAASIIASDPSVTTDTTTGQPSLGSEFSDTWTGSNRPYVEAFYDAKGVAIGTLYYAWKRNPNMGTSAPWFWDVVMSSDDVFSAFDGPTTLTAAGPGTGTMTASPGRYFASARAGFAGAGGTAGMVYAIYWTCLAVYGRHGLTLQGTNSATSAQGVLASDVIANAVSRWAPALTVTTGTDGSVTASAFVIPQLAFTDPTTTSEIITQANRFELRDWAVWENKTFWMYDAGQKGRKWRARVGPSRLSETGPQVSRLWNGVIVIYQDVTGITRTVGPTGSGANTTSSSLLDTDETNPANQLGIRRWTQLDMGTTSTPAAAIQVGQQFLTLTKALDGSGSAQLVGTVEDDRGIERPAWMVRAGDYISFVDAADTSYRKIVHASYDASTVTASIDLDAPPEGLDALLQRLQVVLVPLGL